MYSNSNGRSYDRSNPFRGTGDKPKREVFPTGEIAHKWAHQTQSRARNAQGNLFFDGATIYSYRRSWPLARIHTKGRPTKGGRPGNPDDYARDCVLVLVNSDRYSVTTSAHQSDVERAAKHLHVLRVPDVDGISHDQNLKHFADVEKTNMATAERAMSEWRFNAAITVARDAINDAAQYMAFFGIRRKAPTFDNERYAKALERINKILHPDEKTKARHEHQRKLRQTKMQQALREQFDAWQSNIASYNARATAYMAERAAAVNLTPEQIAQHWRDTGEWPRGVMRGADAPYPPYSSYKAERKYRNAGFTMPEIVRIPHDGIERPRDVLLRISDGEIVTSLGARVPIAAAPMVWALVQRARAGHDHAESAQAFGRRLRIGDYPLDRIDADGTLHAGCHTIKYAELERLARALKLADGAPS